MVEVSTEGLEVITAVIRCGKLFNPPRSEFLMRELSVACMSAIQLPHLKHSLDRLTVSADCRVLNGFVVAEPPLPSLRSQSECLPSLPKLCPRVDLLSNAPVDELEAVQIGMRLEFALPSVCLI